MHSFVDMVWVESRKAVRSRLPLWTALASLFLPIGIAFLIFVSKNPEISQKLGLVSAKANLVAYAGTDWPAYLSLFGQLVAVGGFMLLILVISWVFGREFADGTLKDMLAVPVPRGSIILAKFFVVAVWSVGLSVVIFLSGMLMGAAMGLPGASLSVLLQGSAVVAITACLVIPVVLPFALFASLGRGYLLPIGVALLTALAMNVVTIIGYGEYFPWAVPELYAQGKTELGAASYGIVLLTGVLGVLATYLWWKYADQSR
jgi:ABC-2 type transport system permease protein